MTIAPLAVPAITVIPKHNVAPIQNAKPVNASIVRQMTKGTVLAVIHIVIALIVNLVLAANARFAAVTRTRHAVTVNVMTLELKNVAQMLLPIISLISTTAAVKAKAVSTVAVKKNSRMNYGAYQKGADAIQW